MGAEMMSYPNTLLMCCPNTDGSAAVVLVSEEKLRTLSKEQQQRAVKISASVLTTDPWTERAQVQPDVNTLTRNAATKAYEISGVDPQDLDLVELHDCFATAELIHYDNLQLCAPGEAGKFIDERGPWRDGKIPVNVSGGLISKGHPIGATGIANVFEVVDAPARRGRRPPDRGRQGRPHARDRPRLRLRRARAREVRRLVRRNAQPNRRELQRYVCLSHAGSG